TGRTQWETEKTCEKVKIGCATADNTVRRRLKTKSIKSKAASALAQNGPAIHVARSFIAAVKCREKFSAGYFLKLDIHDHFTPRKWRGGTPSHSIFHPICLGRGFTGHSMQTTEPSSTGLRPTLRFYRFIEHSPLGNPN
ncbi:hypothetical protein AVEN_99587-1, partial [Araneus ventricosus]